MKIKCSPRDLGKLERKLAEKFPAKAQAALRAGARACVPLLQEATRNARPASASGPRGAVASGAFLRAWRWRIVRKWQVAVENTATYARFVEEGRQPGARPPPVRAIQQWMAHRGLAPSRATAYLIARSIGLRGVRGRFIANTLRSRMTKLVHQHLTAAANAALDSAARASR